MREKMNSMKVLMGILTASISVIAIVAIAFTVRTFSSPAQTGEELFKQAQQITRDAEKLVIEAISNPEVKFSDVEKQFKKSFSLYKDAFSRGYLPAERKLLQLKMR
ncbi:hypothetical protein E4T80_01725 [Muribacter muris]|uniref:Uncharacterized protein n=1 Tax=Muribacter muris TaxID=67855 RepID=A0A4Y9K484_9PAST|nr:hypothetical protein [Muribacter muris]MBF0784197.1 hypothetical protein [Muribacter muris]MBF0827168.1 hypothetical protein [Muribacter muris]TFV12941.1 hypothetical protein E4T80_01725 [Muribacter muris]